MVTGGLIGVMGGFMYAYQNSAGRLMGFFPNEGEVAKYKKWFECFFFFFQNFVRFLPYKKNSSWWLYSDIAEAFDDVF